MRAATSLNPPVDRGTTAGGVPLPDASASHGTSVSRLPQTRLSFRARARLASEIVATYIQARRELQSAPIESAIAALRADPSLPAPADPAEGLEEARRLGWVVARTLRLLPGDTRCLTRSLVLTRLLARRGIPAKLVIGARPAPQFLAHAWVECDGEPVLARGDGSFSRLVEL
jgi:Transglutaminase-like superfamily